MAEKQVKQEYSAVELAEAVPAEDNGTDLAAPTSAAASKVQVVAPATLPAGYSFQAAIGEEVVSVVVPPGGVVEGQSFAVDTSKTVDRSLGSSVPVGDWKDGLCDCCSYGCCHPQLCLTIWAKPCALAQVMQRLNLNWSASPAGPGTPTFSTIFLITVAVMVIAGVLGAIMVVAAGPNYGYYDPNTDRFSNGPPEMPGLYIFAYALRYCINLVFGIYMLVILIKTRAYIRNKYAIPEQCCHGCEDCCVGFWCGSCSICQMARHTADYDQYHAMCCTPTGLSPRAPSIV